MSQNKDGILKRVIAYLNERGFEVYRIRDDLLRARQNKLSISVWFSDKDYLEWYDPLNIIDEFQLTEVNALIIIAPRAYTIADEVLHSLDRARYWYDLFINVKVYSVEITLIDKNLEEVINNVLTSFIDLASNIILRGCRCPRCLSDMYTMYMNKFYSRILRDVALEYIYRCANCSLKIHRLERVY